MKYRNGFVSNSSSSSFILELEQEYDKEWMKDKLYQDNESIRTQNYLREEVLSVDTLMKWIDSEFTADESKITTFEQFSEHYSLGWEEGPDMDDEKYKFPEYELRRDWELYQKDCDEFKLNRCKELWPKFEQAAKEGRLYTISFSDEEGRVGCELEHYTSWTTIFNGLYFSHH